MMLDLQGDTQKKFDEPILGFGISTKPSQDEDDP
jgi:hypothetical protein